MLLFSCIMKLNNTYFFKEWWDENIMVYRNLILFAAIAELITMPVMATCTEKNSIGNNEVTSSSVKQNSSITEKEVTSSYDKTEKKPTNNYQGNRNSDIISESSKSDSNDLSNNSFIEKNSYLQENWEFEVKENMIVLNKYIGESSIIIIPSKIDQRQVALKDINEEIIPRNITQFSIESSGENERLLIIDDDLINGFKDCRNLTTIDLSHLDTTNIKSMENLFGNCDKLTEVNMNNLNTKSLLSVSNMFNGCIKLSEIALKNWDTSAIKNMEKMFYNCAILKVIDLSDFLLDEEVVTSEMFTTEQTNELLVIAKDPAFFSLNNNSLKNRVPISTPFFRANGGEFSNGEKKISYFEKCVNMPEKLSLESFEEFKEKNKPEGIGFAKTFVNWKSHDGNKEVKTVLDLLNTTYIATWKNDDWEFEENENEILLKKYIGQETEITIPGEINGKQVVLDDINTNIIPQKVTKFITQEKNGKKVKLKQNSLRQAFYNNKAIKEVDLRGLDTTGNIDFHEMFRDCSNLLKVNMENINTSEVLSFSNMFYECQKLTNIDLSGLNARKVTNMGGMFYNCYEIENINLTNMQTHDIQTTEKMFYNCFINKDLSVLDLSSFETPNLINSNRMFNGAKLPPILYMNNFKMDNVANYNLMFYGNEPQEILIVTKDEKLLNYNYVNDKKYPLENPKLNAGEGAFSGRNNMKSYFTNCAEVPEKLSKGSFNKFLDTSVPTLPNAVFKGWKIEQPSNNNSNLKKLNTNYEAIWKNMSCNTTVDNKKVTTSGALGIVYFPKKFEFTEVSLSDSGKQVIPFNKQESLNVGIRDFSQTNSNWVLQCSLNWGENPIEDAYIQFDGDVNNIKKNMNNNKTEFDSKRDLQNCNDEVQILSKENSKVIVKTSEQTNILTSNNEKTHDDIYDYNLGEASLVVPKAEMLKADNYDANIQWNLMNAPH